MEEEKIVISYCGNTDEHLNWALGVFACKSNIIKRKKVRVRSQTEITKRSFVYGSIYAALSGIMIVLSLWLILLGERVPTFCAIVMTYLLCKGLLLLYATKVMKKQYERMRKNRNENISSGELIFDSFGIEDVSEDGKSMRLPWSEYEACVIVKDMAVLLMSDAFYYVSIDLGTEQGICHALSHYGKADTIIDCR